MVVAIFARFGVSTAHVCVYMRELKNQFCRNLDSVRIDFKEVMNAMSALMDRLRVLGFPRLMLLALVVWPCVSTIALGQDLSGKPGCTQVSHRACTVAAALSRGINMGGMLDAPREGDWGVRLDHRYADTIAGKFQTVRLPVRWSNHASPDADARIDPVFLKRVSAAVNAFLSKGLYVIVDVHQYQQLMGERLHPKEFKVDDAVVDARLFNIWRQLAVHFKDYPDRLIFELLNEPTGRLSHDVWNGMIPRLIDIVRETNPTRIVIVGGARGNYIKELPNLKLPNDPHVIATVHTYDPFNFTHQGATWIPLSLPHGVACCDAKQKAQINEGLNIARDWSVKNGRPVYLGEFGVYKAADGESRASYARLVRTEAEKRGISWAYWDFANAFGAYSPRTESWLPGMLEALTD